ELLDPEVLAKLVHDRQQRVGLAERDAAALEPRRRLARRRQSPVEFEQQPRLADARLAGDEHDLPAPLANPIEALHERGELLIAPDQRGEAALALDVEPSLPAPGAHDLERMDRRVALYRQLAQVECLEVSRDQPMRRGAGQHAARLRALLQARGDVGRVADGRVVHAEIVADFPHDDRTGVEPDPHLEAPLEPGLELEAQVTDRALDRAR